MTLDTGMLLSLLTGDPAGREAQLSKLLTQQFAGAATQPTAPQDGSPASALYREAQLLDDEVRRLLAIVADAAGALGACPRCLGTEESCPACAGTGKPGSTEPDRELFAELIAPAVIRVVDEEGALDTS